MSDPLNGSNWRIDRGDVLTWLASLPEQSCDLVFGSPPYTMARLYLENGENLGIARNAEQWASWMVDVVKASLRVCRGLVAFVVEGQTKHFRWDAAPALLMADLHRAGICLRKPPIYRRVGIPGSGGPDWLRNDYEFIVCCTNGGKLPWSDNTAMGHAPKWAPGGEMSYRLTDGQRVNQWGKTGTESVNGHAHRKKDGRRQKATRPGHVMTTKRGATRGYRDGDTLNDGVYIPPAIANPGNVVQELYTAEQVADVIGDPTDVVDCKAGGGQMGSGLCHTNEAPFPEKLAEFFVRSFCREGGIVVDPFSGSGTTAAVSVRWGRRALCCDLRESQVLLSRRRVKESEPALFTREGELP